MSKINVHSEEYLGLSYRGLRARENSFTVTLLNHFDRAAGEINIIRQDIERVLLHLYNNAFYAVSEKRRQKYDGLSAESTEGGIGAHRFSNYEKD